MKLKYILVFLLPLLVLLHGCSNKDEPPRYEHKVMTQQDIERALYGKMIAAKVAMPMKDEPGKLRIVDIKQARSEFSLAVLLNELGIEGWELTGINQSQLYFFRRPSKIKEHVQREYKVVTLAELDKMIFSRLVTQNAAVPLNGQPGKYRITDVEKAKSQNIMAVVLNDLAEEKWQLGGVNKANLYLFSRIGKGTTQFTEPSPALIQAAQQRETARLQEKRRQQARLAAEAKKKALEEKAKGVDEKKQDSKKSQNKSGPSNKSKSKKSSSSKKTKANQNKR